MLLKRLLRIRPLLYSQRAWYQNSFVYLGIGFLALIVTIYKLIKNGIINLSFIDKGVITISDLSGIATAIALLFTATQIMQSRRQHIKENQKQAIKEAASLARVFREECLRKISFIAEVRRKAKIDEFVSSKVTEDVEYRFTAEEAKRLFGIDTYLYMLWNIEPKVIKNSAVSNGLGQFTLCSTDSAEESDMRDRIEKANALCMLDNCINDVMNDLEWMAMIINSRAADDNTIYQSLHQAIFMFILGNYFRYCYSNTEDNLSDKYYTNTIRLYHRWNNYNLYMKCLEKESILNQKKKQARRDEKRRKRDTFTTMGTKI